MISETRLTNWYPWLTVIPNSSFLQAYMFWPMIETNVFLFGLVHFHPLATEIWNSHLILWSKSSQISFFSKCRSIFLPSYWIIKRNEHRYRIREKAGSIFVFSSFWFGGKKVQVSWIPSIKSLPRPNLKCVTLQRRKILSHFLNIDGVLEHVYFMLNNHHYNAFTFLS